MFFGQFEACEIDNYIISPICFAGNDIITIISFELPASPVNLFILLWENHNAVSASKNTVDSTVTYKEIPCTYMAVLLRH